jgi:uncharacterized protein (TIGR03067 family)
MLIPLIPPETVMRFALTALALTATALVATADDPKAKAKDTDAIVGSWKIDKFDSGGGPGGPPKELLDSMRLTFLKDGKMEMSGGPGGEKMAGEFKLDPAAKLKTIDLVREGKTAAGIYELDGDTLKLCIAEPPGSARPAEMKADGKGIAVVTLKRVKEEKK